MSDPSPSRRARLTLVDAAHRVDEPFGSFPRVLVETSLERVLRSATFRRSDRHRRFLRHIVAATLDGRSDRLKEVLLGLEVFDRRSHSFDPRRDPIVRMEAGRVRDKLDRYYRDEGADDPFVFSIPVGGYVPRFGRRDDALDAADAVETFAVLPFATGGSEGDAAFAIGLADQLIGRLSRRSDLKVIGRVSSATAGARRLAPREIGRTLHVGRIVDGSIQRQGDRLRCVAHILRAHDGTCLWSRSFDSAYDGRGVDGAGVDAAADTAVDAFAFQDHIVDVVFAAATAGTDVVHDAPVRADGATPAGSASATRRRARDLFEQAGRLARHYDAATGDEVARLLDEAATLDATNGRIQVALALAWLHRVTQNRVLGATALPAIEAALDRAIAFDPRDSRALALRAMLAFRFRFDWAEAERLFRDALRISPHDSDVNYRYAFGLVFNGRFDEGLRHAAVAIEVDPLNLPLRAMAAQLRGYARDYAGAEAEARAVLESEPGHVYTNFVLAMLHVHQQRYDAAGSRFDALIEAHPGLPNAVLGRVVVLGLQGELVRAREALDDFLARQGDRYFPSYALAVALLALGDRAGCHAALHRAARERDSSFCSAQVDPLFDAESRDPAFRALLAGYGLRAAAR